jgi:hypothetical protein
MSLYEALFRRNPIWQSLAILLGIGEGSLFTTQVKRLRDMYLVKHKEEFTIRVFTRLGGDNRDEYSHTIVALRQHRGYIRDWDEAADATYATFEYRFPYDVSEPNLADTFYRLQGGEYTEPLKKFRALIDRMETSNPTTDPELARAFEIKRRLKAEIAAPPELDEHGNPKPKIIKI